MSGAKIPADPSETNQATRKRVNWGLIGLDVGMFAAIFGWWFGWIGFVYWLDSNEPEPLWWLPRLGISAILGTGAAFFVGMILGYVIEGLVELVEVIGDAVRHVRENWIETVDASPNDSDQSSDG